MRSGKPSSLLFLFADSTAGSVSVLTAIASIRSVNMPGPNRSSSFEISYFPAWILFCQKFLQSLFSFSVVLLNLFPCAPCKIVAGQADENGFSGLEGACQQFFVTSVNMVECTAESYLSVLVRRLHRLERMG